MATDEDRDYAAGVETQVSAESENEQNEQAGRKISRQALTIGVLAQTLNTSIEKEQAAIEVAAQYRTALIKIIVDTELGRPPEQLARTAHNALLDSHSPYREELDELRKATDATG